MPDGSRYKGQMKKGLPDGLGKLVWYSGDYYKGEFKNGKRHGRGKRVNIDGSVFIGEYVDENPTG